MERHCIIYLCWNSSNETTPWLFVSASIVRLRVKNWTLKAMCHLDIPFELLPNVCLKLFFENSLSCSFLAFLFKLFVSCFTSCSWCLGHSRLSRYLEVIQRLRDNFGSKSVKTPPQWVLTMLPHFRHWAEGQWHVWLWSFLFVTSTRCFCICGYSFGRSKISYVRRKRPQLQCSLLSFLNFQDTLIGNGHCSCSKAQCVCFLESSRRDGYLTIRHTL